MSDLLNLSRRAFVLGGAALGGGLVLGFAVRPREASARAAQGAVTVFGPWIRIATDGQVTLCVEKSEMGQGVYTSLGMLLADELDADWARVQVIFPPDEGPPSSYFTGISMSVRSSWQPLRRAGASAREMLVAAAAAVWNVPAAECRARHGRVVHGGSARELDFGALAERAAALPVPASPRLKSRAEQHLVGRAVPRVDLPAKVDGSAIFGIDVEVPGMLHAAVRTSPAFGGKLLGFDEPAARASSGVRAVVPIPDGVAIVADSSWQAARGLDALAPRFSKGTLSSAAFSARLHAALGEPGTTALLRGDPDAALNGAAGVVEARYEVPFLAHATLEPMNATAHVRADGCEIWAPTQAQGLTRQRVARLLEIPIERVRLHTTLLGGGFGRRFEDDFVVQAVLASRAVGRPVKVLWSREEDLRHDFYRPAYASLQRAVLDRNGMPLARTQRIAGPSLEARDSPEWLQRAGGALQRRFDAGIPSDSLPGFLRGRVPEWLGAPISRAAVDGSEMRSYGIPSQRIEYALVECPVPVGFWRSVGHSQNAFFSECFIDELAAAAGRDPLDYRRALLAEAPRARAVLELAADRAGWSRAAPPGRARGVAFHESFDTLVCQIAEISLDADKRPRVHRVVCALDCGSVVNPDTVAAQMEGAIVFGLSAALHGGIELRDGAVVQTGFHDQPLVGLADCPEIEVHRIESDAPPGGVGEPGTPPIAPAVCNALFAAGGERVRKLPLLAASR